VTGLPWRVPGRTPRRRLLNVLVVGPVILGAVLVGCSGGNEARGGDETRGDVADDARSTVVPRGAPLDVETDFPASLVALPNGALLVGELATGKILRLSEIAGSGSGSGSGALGVGRSEVVAVLPVAPDGGFPLQVGLTGLATDPSGARIFAAWVRGSDNRMVVSEVVGESRREVWVGPAAATQASGGRLVWWRGRLVLSIGDRLQRRTADPPMDDLRSALVSLDPDGEKSQQPRIVSTDWNNPFAVAVDGSDRLLVADNVPKDGPERLGVTTEAGATVVSDLGSGDEHIAPAGMLELRPGVAWICGWISGVVTEVPIAPDGMARWADRTDRADIPCSLDAVRLSDGRVAVSTDSQVRIVTPR